jgi:hypothetical protein
MSTTSKFALSVGLASGALVTAWLLTGDRKQKTKRYLVKGTSTLKKALKTSQSTFDDSEVYYI